MQKKNMLNPFWLNWRCFKWFHWNFIQKTRKNACSSSIWRTIQPTKHCNLSAFWIGNNICNRCIDQLLVCLFSRQFMATRCSRNYIPSTEFSFYMCFRVLWILYDFLETLLPSFTRFMGLFQMKKKPDFFFERQFVANFCHFQRALHAI